MAGEVIPIAFDGTQAIQFLDEIEQRLQRTSAQVSSVVSPGPSSATGGAGRSSLAGSGGGGGGGGIGDGAVLNTILAALNNLNGQVGSAESSRSPYEIGNGNDLFGGSYANRAKLNLEYNAPADLIAKIPGGQAFAEYYRKKGQAAERDVFEPTENTVGRLAGIGTALARANVNLSDRDLDLAHELVIQQERRAYDFKKRLYQREYSAGAMQDAWTHAFNH